MVLPNRMSGPRSRSGKINVTDPDSRNVKSPRGWVQGYNAQAVVNENHIVLAAEVTSDSPDFGHLEPMITATERQLEAIGVTETPQVTLADAGYWHQVQMQKVAARGLPVLVPPDASKRAGARPGWNDGMYAFMRRVLATELGAQLYRRRQALVEPVFADIEVQPQDRALPTTRTLRRAIRMETSQRDAQPAQAPTANSSPPPAPEPPRRPPGRLPADVRRPFASRWSRPRTGLNTSAEDLIDSHRAKEEAPHSSPLGRPSRASSRGNPATQPPSKLS